MCACRVALVVSDSVNPWTVAHQAPLSMEFSSHEKWSWVPFPSPGNLPEAGIKPTSLMSPALAGGFFTTYTTWSAQLPHIVWSLISHYNKLLRVVFGI